MRLDDLDQITTLARRRASVAASLDHLPDAHVVVVIDGVAADAFGDAVRPALRLAMTYEVADLTAQLEDLGVAVDA